MWQVGVSNGVDCCRVVGWWTPIFFFFVFFPEGRLGWVGGGGRVPWCGLLLGCWMVDADFFFLCLFARLPGVDGTGVVVVRKFVFRIVDGTGMFSVSS